MRILQALKKLMTVNDESERGLVKIYKKVTNISKVSILGVESLLPFCAWLFQGRRGVKNAPILYNLALNKILSSKLEILH